MNKKVSLVLFLFMCGSFLLSGNERQDLWIKAAAEKNPEIKIQLFEQYKQKYGDNKRDKNIKFLFYNLAQTSFVLKKFEKTIEYGEKTLTFEDLEDHYKVNISLWLANAYNLARKDYDKAYSYAGMVIDFGKSIKEMAEGLQRAEEISKGVDKRYLAPALRIQIRILLAKGLNDNTRREVIEKGIFAYELDPGNEFSKRTVLKESVELAKKNLINEAIAAIEKVVDHEDLTYGESNLLARLYYHRYSKGKADQDKDKAIECYEKAYAKKKRSSMAVKIGQLLSKKDKDKAISYFAEAYILSESDKESDAYKYLQQLWFKDKAKDKTPEEQEAGFKDIINAANIRLGEG
ncbi:MAG: hypothetical protein KAT34_15515 [Candidatus Aminicenantes bacterium]|nr:hypothetical protein [Candidatus Aminicenantes bacterium]